MKNFVLSLQAALYTASIIIGAGVLTLPYVARVIGVVPLFGLILVVSLILYALYSRMADTVFGTVQQTATRLGNEITVLLEKGMGVPPSNEVKLSLKSILFRRETSKGAEVFDVSARRAGLKRAGFAALLFGMILYVLPADIGYVVIGSRTLNSVAGLMGNFGNTMSIASVLVGVATVLSVFRFNRRTAAVKARTATLLKFAVMVGMWATAFGILGLINRDSALIGKATVGPVLGVVGFLIAILSAMVTGHKMVERDEDRIALSAEHRVSVIVMSIEIGLLLLSALAILVIFAANGMLEKAYLFPTDGLANIDANVWATALGVVLFAFVGTGIFNLVVYSWLFEPGTANRPPLFKTVVALGTLIPFVIYVGWTMVSAATLTPAEMAIADGHGDPTHIAILNKILNIDPTLALVVSITGYLFALAAVTSACVGFTESLADRIRITLAHSRLRRYANVDYRPWILFTAASMALLPDITATPIALSTILALAGNAGGGLLILIFPLFLPYPVARQNPRKIDTVLAVVATVVVVWAIWQVDTPSVFLTLVKGAIAASLAGITLWLAISETP